LEDKVNALIEKAIEIEAAAAAAHVHEIGFSNSGKEVDAYLADVGLPPRLPWCAAFQCWSVDTAGAALGYRIPFRSGSCPEIEAWARRRGVFHQSAPQVGDWALLQEWDSNGQYSGHIGMVVGLPGGGLMQTIEGNTSPGTGGSQTDGGGVYRREHSIAGWYFVRWIDAVEKLARPVRIEMVDRAGGRRVIDCHAALEAGRTRADVRPLAEALGARVDTSDAVLHGAYVLRPSIPGPALELTLADGAGRPALENGRLRAELRHVAQGLGFQVDTSQFSAGLVRLHR
jgi:hypothetical protein